MTTPATYSTAYRLIKQAYKNAAKIGDGQNPSSEQFAEGMNLFNDMINLWQTQGLRLWLQADLPVTLTPGIALYTFGLGGTVPMSRPTRVIQGYYQDVNGNRRPLTPPLSRQEYFTLSQVKQQGPVTQYYADKQVNSLNVYFWLTPDQIAATNGTAHLLIQQQVENIVSLTDQMDFPIEWYLALHWGLSTLLCTGQPQSVIERCEKMAFATYDTVSNWDVEDASTVFQVDPRTGNQGNFR